MSSEQNWRTATDTYDYLLHQQKKNAVADRRPVIRQANDLVGPGIASTAVRLTNFNDVLATYNGFFSADVAAANAPNNTEQFVGHITSDAVIGGVQTFTAMTSEKIYQRAFRRNPGDPNTIYWGSWKVTFLGTGL